MRINLAYYPKYQPFQNAFILETTITDITHDQSIDQIASDQDNDGKQNETEIKKDRQVFDLNDMEGITRTRTVSNDEDPENEELIN